MARLAQTEQPAATRFACLVPEGRAVFLAGTFNGWGPATTPLIKGAGGNWEVALDLPPGHHEYKFVVDGKWCCEPGCDETNQCCPKCVPNTFGTMNRVAGVKA